MLPVKVLDIRPRLLFGQTVKSDRKIFRVALVQSFRIELKFRVKAIAGVHRLLERRSIVGPIVDRLPVAVKGVIPVTVGIVRIISTARSKPRSSGSAPRLAMAAVPKLQTGPPTAGQS